MCLNHAWCLNEHMHCWKQPKAGLEGTKHHHGLSAQAGLVNAAWDRPVIACVDCHGISSIVNEHEDEPPVGEDAFPAGFGPVSWDLLKGAMILHNPQHPNWLLLHPTKLKPSRGTTPKQQVTPHPGRCGAICRGQGFLRIEPQCPGHRWGLNKEPWWGGEGGLKQRMARNRTLKLMRCAYEANATDSFTRSTAHISWCLSQKLPNAQMSHCCTLTFLSRLPPHWESFPPSRRLTTGIWEDWRVGACPTTSCCNKKLSTFTVPNKVVAKGLLMVVSKRWFEFCPESEFRYPLFTSF